MQLLRTPDARFVGLPDFPFAPHYTEIANPGGTSLRIHYLDEGPPPASARRAELVLPLPPHDPVARGAWPQSAGARPRGLWPVGQAGSPDRLYFRASRRLDEHMADRARSQGHHTVLSGLGRIDRA